MASGRRNYIKEEMMDRLERTDSRKETPDEIRRRREEELRWNSTPDPEDEFLARKKAQRQDTQKAQSNRPVRTPWGEAPRQKKKKPKKNTASK